MLELSAISNLLGSSCPSAISWFVVAIYVLTVERMFFRWGISYVFIEGLKAFTPASANCDASTSVITKEISFRIFNSINHSAPSDIDLSSAFAVRSGTIAKKLSFSTAAICAFTQTKITGLGDGFNGSAFTFANPSRFIESVVFRVSGKNFPKAESLSSKINQGWHIRKEV